MKKLIIAIISIFTIVAVATITFLVFNRTQQVVQTEKPIKKALTNITVNLYRSPTDQ